MARRLLYINNIFILLFFFVYIYGLKFFFLPYRINTLIGLLTVSFLAAKVLVKKDLVVSKNILLIDILTLFVVIVSLISMTYNQTADFSFNRPNIVSLIDIFTAYFLMTLLKKQYWNVDFQTIGNFYIGAALLQVLFSLFFLISPDVRSVMNGLLSFSEMSEGKMMNATNRVIGFGAGYFGAGVIYSFILILIVAIVKNNIFSIKKLFFYVCAFIIIFTIGMMTARTTLFGGMLSIFLLVYKNNTVRQKNKFLLSKILFCLLVFGIIIFTIFYLNENLRNSFARLFSYGFELFVNYFNGRGLRTESSDNTLNGFFLPTDTKTWLIGDGYYVDPTNPNLAYYMRTDVGYSRYLFYFGIIGTLIYLLLNGFIICFTAIKNEKKYRLFFFIVFILFLALNIKGASSLSIYLFPFLFVNKIKKK